MRKYFRFLNPVFWLYLEMADFWDKWINKCPKGFKRFVRTLLGTFAITLGFLSTFAFWTFSIGLLIYYSVEYIQVFAVVVAILLIASIVYAFSPEKPKLD